jgi:hypothetical protein
VSDPLTRVGSGGNNSPRRNVGERGGRMIQSTAVEYWRDERQLLPAFARSSARAANSGLWNWPPFAHIWPTSRPARLDGPSYQARFRRGARHAGAPKP